MQNDIDFPSFRGLDPVAPVRIYRRNLPHWRQDGATYAVTFRLADSIPAQIVRAWHEEDRIWLEANGITEPLSDPKARAAYDALDENVRRAFERSLAHRLHVELDQCHGSCRLAQPDIRQVIVDALMHYDTQKWYVGDFVVMPNHVHGLFQPLNGHELETLLASVKGFTSSTLTKTGLKQGRFWQQENYDRLVRDRKELESWRKYIADNPTKIHASKDTFTHYQCTWLDANP